jgi:hypothetical protein
MFIKKIQLYIIFNYNVFATIKFVCLFKVIKITLKNYIGNYRNKFDCYKDIIIEYYV